MSFYNPISMSDRKTHAEDEQLFDTKGDDAATDAAVDTKEGDEESIKEPSDGEQKQEALDLSDPIQEDKSKASKSQEVREQQAISWANKIALGERSMDDLPKNLNWLKGDIENKLLEMSPEPASEESNVEYIVSQKLQEEREKDMFESTKQALKTADLTREQRETIQEKFKKLRKSNVPQLLALETAMEVAKVDLEELDITTRKSGMKIPSSRSSVGKGEITKDTPYSEIHKNLPPEKRVKMLKELINEGGIQY